MATSSASPVQKHAITVLPPWWRTTPFYLACAMLSLVVLTLLYRLRVRRLLRRQLMTEQLVRERTRELELSREQLRQRALKDSLTGAWNRGAIMEIIEHALEQALAQQLPLLLVLLDLDHFKRVNDNYGHAAGDAVLREAVTRLGAAVRQTDAVGRYGGEEFLMLLPGLDQAGGHARVEELRHAIRCAPIRISDEQSITVTGSFGAIAFDPRRPLPAAELIDRADQALYRSKENGRDRIEYAPAA
jgi:diguanylate cyclase (GGDEF)-like protein